MTEHDGDAGLGGLTLEPPPSPDGGNEEIGFAPDLLDGPTLQNNLPETVIPARASGQSYPRAREVIAALLGEPLEPPTRERPPPLPPKAQKAGPAIMRPPPPIVRAPPPAPEPSENEGMDRKPEEMVDVMLVGTTEGGHEVHLTFKDEVMKGLYVRLERTDAGLMAHFSVRDAMDRRALEGQIDGLMNRLSSRGMKLAGHTVSVRPPDAEDG